MEYHWNFAAPSKVNLQAFVPHRSCSLLSPGRYLLNYRFSYYGPLQGDTGNFGYCFYSVHNAMAFAGLYNRYYVKHKGTWQQEPQGFVCLSSSKCTFRFRK
jgi:hypothetical protein